MSRSNHALAKDEPAPLTVIGGDIEDDEEEAPTVLATDLSELGIPELSLVQPTWEQPDGVGEADTAPESRSPVADLPVDPSRTFPAEDEICAVEVEVEPEPAEPEERQPPVEATARVSPSASSSSAGASGNSTLTVLVAVGAGVAVVGAISLGIAVLWMM